MESMREMRGRHQVVLVPLPFQGHINPMLQLASILHSRGFSITIVHTYFNAPNPSNHPYFKFIPINDGLSDDEASSQDFVALILALNLNCQAPFNKCLVGMMEENQQNPIACIISDAVMYFTHSVATHLKLPTLILRTNSVNSFVPFAALPLLQQKGYLPVKDTLSQEPVPELPPLRVKDLPEFNRGKIENLLEYHANVMNALRTSSGIIWNTFDYLEKTTLPQVQRDISVPFFLIGPMHKWYDSISSSSSSLIMEDTNCINWLDQQMPRTVMYVSFGSMAVMDDKELMETAWGLANSEQPFLWVVRPGSVSVSEWMKLLPEGFKEMTRGRGCIVKWAPQERVLSHPAVGGFWTHCGWNSTLEGVSEGVPLLCWPWFGDQKVSARYVSHVWRVGLEMENGLERGEIERGIRRVMVDIEGKEIRQRAMDLKEKVDACVKQGGSAYKSLDRLVHHILSL